MINKNLKIRNLYFFIFYFGIYLLRELTNNYFLPINIIEITFIFLLCSIFYLITNLINTNDKINKNLTVIGIFILVLFLYFRPIDFKNIFYNYNFYLTNIAVIIIMITYFFILNFVAKKSFFNNFISYIIFIPYTIKFIIINIFKLTSLYEFVPYIEILATIIVLIAFSKKNNK